MAAAGWPASSVGCSRDTSACSRSRSDSNPLCARAYRALVINNSRAPSGSAAIISRAVFLASSNRVPPGLPLRAPMLALTSTMSTASWECRAANCHCGCASAKPSSAARASNTIKFKSRNRRCRLLLLLSRIFIAACQNIRLDTVASSRFGRRRYK